MSFVQMNNDPLRVIAAALMLSSAVVGCENSSGAATEVPSAQEEGSERSGIGPAEIDAGSVTLIQELRIDGYTEELGSIGWNAPSVSLAVSEDEQIAFRQFEDRQVRVYRPGSDTAVVIGGSGNGPGEFIYVGQMGWIGDTLWVADGQLSRLTFFGLDGSDPETRSWASGVHLPSDQTRPFRSVNPSLVLPGGGSYIAQLIESGSSFGPVRFGEYSVLGRVAWNGAVEKIVTLVPFSEVSFETPTGRLASPFPNRSFLQVNQDGSRAAVAMADLTGAEAGTFSLTVVSSEADTLFTRTYPFEGVVIGDGERSRAVERVVGRSGIKASDVPVPPVYPPLTGLLIGRDDLIWVEFRVARDERRYLVLDSAEGDPRGIVVLPADSRIAVASRHRVWALERDALDVESVVQYGLTWN